MYRPDVLYLLLPLLAIMALSIRRCSTCAALVESSVQGFIL